MNIQLARKLLLVVMAGTALTSCSTGKNAGLSLGVSVAPTKAFVVPGKGVSCVAQATAKVDATVPLADVTGDRVLFNRFALQWRSGDKLTIAAITAKIFSTGITGAETIDGLEIVLSETEIAALLGLSSLTIQFSNPYNVDRVYSVDSTDPTKGASFAPCGLHLGGLAAVKGVTSYTARIRIEVTGYKTACVLQTDQSCLDGEQSPVRQSVTVSAQKY